MYQQQWTAPPVQAPPPSTRMLTTITWLTVVVSSLLTVAGVFWIRFLHDSLAFLEHYSAKADEASGDGKGLKGGTEAIASAEVNVVIGYSTVAAIVLLGVLALCAGAGVRWARVCTAILMAGPIGVVVYGVADGGSESLWALSLLTPFVTLAVLWCLPGVTRAMAVKRWRRATGR